MYVAVNADTGGLDLRLGTMVLNQGAGPLDLVGTYEPTRDQTVVSQLVQTTDGEPIHRFAGAFVYHPAHFHWHFEDFIVFELWTYRPDGSLGTLLSSSGKITFCIFDTVLLEPSDDAPEAPVCDTCDRDVQGISVGWGDLYASDVPGQRLSIEGVPDGRYALRTLVDPDNLLMEQDDTNNSNVVHLEIAGRTLEVLDEP
jgi:hypothetical protein